MHILYATDGSEGALAAARFLKLIPLSHPELSLITVVGDVEDGKGEQALTSARDALRGADVVITSEILRGHPAEEILRAAEAKRPDLLVLGSRGLGAVASFFLGSVAVRVARHAPCPVLVARPPKGKLDRVVVGVDGSDCAAYAADWTLRLPLPEGCEIDLITVVTPRAQAMTMSRALLSPALLAEMKTIMQLERKEALERLADLAATFAAAGKKAVPGIRPDHPALGLLSAAEERQADLIVLGAHGLSALDRLLLGSVSGHVLRYAHCSVLVVRPCRRVS